MMAIRNGDGFLDRFIKFVPIEIITLFLVSSVLLPASAWVGWSLLSAAAGVVLGSVVLYWDAARVATTVPIIQYVVRTIVFVSWVIALSAQVATKLGLRAEVGALAALILPLAGALATMPRTGRT